MRVVAGSARGRRLVAPDGSDTRPTSDRVRESVFNALTSLEAVRDATVLDLFAGSGALGIEALSRGAAHTTFVDTRRAALDAVRQNLDTTGLAAHATVVAADATTFLARKTDRFDLALLDPPYVFDQWDRLLATVPADLVVVESDRVVDLGAAWVVVRNRRYGATVVLFARRAPSE